MKRNHTLLRSEVWFLVLTFMFVFQFSQNALGAVRLFPAFYRFAETTAGNNLQGGAEFQGITKDGRFVTYSTNENKIISDSIDTNDYTDVYMTDLWTRTTVLVSHSTSGATSPANGLSDQPSISEVFLDDSTYKIRVAFRSCATNVITSEGGNASCDSLYHVYVKEYNVSNLSVTNTYLASQKSDGTDANGTSMGPKISGNGTYVAFETDSTNLATDSNGWDIYRKTLPNGSIDFITPSATIGDHGSSRVPSISYDGNFICFESNSKNLDSTYGYTNSWTQIYKWSSAGTRMVSRQSAADGGAYGDEHSGGVGTIRNHTCDISDDGQLVVFQSRADNLVSETESGQFDVYLRDTSGLTTTLVSTSSGNNFSSLEPNISGNKRFVAFREAKADPGGWLKIKLIDRTLGTTREFNAAASAPYSDISETGRVAFNSSSSLIDSSTSKKRSIIYDVVAPAQLNNGDFNRDGVVDIAFFRPSTGVWNIGYSPDYNLGSFTPGTYSWGTSGDIPAPGDYDRDAVTDYAVFRPSNGYWYITYSGSGSTASLAWGTSGDKPVPADYDGDGRTDLAVYRPSNGNWYITYSSDSSTATISFGLTADVPVPGDYDKDLKADIAVYRPYETGQSSDQRGNWYVVCSSGASGVCSAGSGYIIENFGGNSGDKPVQNDYSGDGKTDFAIYRPGSPNSHWLFKEVGAGGYSDITWGISTDVAMPGEYDNDGKADFAIFRRDTGSPEGSGTWYILKSSDFNYYTAVFGKSSDVFVPNANFP